MYEYIQHLGVGDSQKIDKISLIVGTFNILSLCFLKSETVSALLCFFRFKYLLGWNRVNYLLKVDYLGENLLGSIIR